MLEGRRLLITGVLTPQSIAFAVAERAQSLGAEVVLSGFGRGMSITTRTATRLPKPAQLIELDVNDEEMLASLADSVRAELGGLDGALHAIAFAPEDALGGNFMATSAESAMLAFRTSAYSLQALGRSLQPLFDEASGDKSIVGLDFDASVAWPSYDWMGVAKAGLESVARYMARDMGPAGVRVNLVAAGPLRTLAAKSVPGFSDLTESWGANAPLGWDVTDNSPVADAVCFLLSDMAAGITGEILHVDGGVHAIGAK